VRAARGACRTIGLRVHLQEALKKKGTKLFESGGNCRFAIVYIFAIRSRRV